MAVIENDVIKVTVSNSGTKNVIRVSPGVAALASVSISLNDLNNVDTSGITNGQTIVYDNGSFVAGDSGAVETINGVAPDPNGDVVIDFSVDGLSDVDVTTPSTGDILKYETNRWVNDSLGKADIDLANVDNTSDADKPVSTATQTALNAKADTSAVPTDLNDLSDVIIVGTPAGNQALIYDVTAGAFKSQVSYTNRFEDEVETGLQISTIYAERGYSVKSEGDGIFIDPSPDTPAAGKVIKRKIYHKTGFITADDVIGDYTLIHTFADDTAYADTVAVFDAFEEGATYGVPPFTLFQTWEEVTAAPSFTGLLNETYGSGAEAAYSTRRLNGNVTDCMVIRRASDSTTTTIGFDGSGNIDESAIETFCTGTSCTVVTWKDQSGNGNDATAPSTGDEPTIYTGGALVKENGKVALDFDGSKYLIYSGATGITTLHFYGAYTVKSHGVYAGILAFKPSGSQSDNNSTSGKALSFQNTAAGYSTFVANGGPLRNNDSSFTYPKFLLADIYQDSGARAFWNSYSNSELTNTYSYTIDEAQGYVFGARVTNGNVASYGNVKWSEAIMYPSNRNTNRVTIRENIGDYFTQNTPLLDTYSGAAAAYSLRKLRTAYTGDAVEVYNGSSYADIGFNVFGELDTVALAAHCGSNNGFVSKWYDQSGNTNTAAQTVTGSMPKIYDGSTGVITPQSNSKPAIQGSSSSLITSAITNEFANGYSYYAVVDDVGYNKVPFKYSTNTNTSFRMFCITSSSGTHKNQNVITSPFQRGDRDGLIQSVFYDGSTNVDVYMSHENGTQNSGSNTVSTLDSTASGHTLTLFAAANGSSNITGQMQELIIWDLNQSDNRTGIETNINTFYNIYS